MNPDAPRPERYPARQTREAAAAIARLHGLARDRIVIAQQNPAAIDAGVFHNDVIAVGNGNVLFAHEMAFLDRQGTYDALRAAFAPGELVVIEVAEADVPLADAVASYLFNTQLVALPDGNGMALIAPGECDTTDSVRAYLQGLVAADNPIAAVHTLDLSQSMRNGGGPACLRLRVVLSQADMNALGARGLLDDALFAELEGWVEHHYREDLRAEDLADPNLLVESREALDLLTQILGLGSIYDFQR